MTRDSYDAPPVGAWDGETYYGRQQVKPAPFDPTVVGGYIFLAGLSGASTIIAALASATDARRKPSRWSRQRRRYDGVVRRAHYLSLLAPTLGSALLVYDLHTPQRFYNMMRIAKKTSPMSIGTWILLSFSTFAGLGGSAQFAADMKPRWRWPRRVAALALPPAAIAGAGLSTYTAALISATSTPIWAAAPRETAVRFASSSIATGAAGLAIGESDPSARRALENVLLASLVIEAAATVASESRFVATGVDSGRSGPWGKVEKYVATGLGVGLPIGLLVASRLGRGDRRLAGLAGLAAIAGSAVLRISMLGVGMESARRPEVSMRFAQPDNLPTQERRPK